MSGDLKQIFADALADPSTGENLDSDVAFASLATAAQGKSEQQYGSTIVAAEEPDWKDVQNQAVALLGRSRDLRIVTTLTIARLNLAGLRGFADALALLRDLLDSHWDLVHPLLDPEDDNDPMMRANAVLGLADPARVLRPIREYPLVSSLRAGRFSWRDLAAATGVIETEAGADKPAEATITAAFRDTDPAALADLHDALVSAIASLKAIGTIFDERAGYGTGPDLSRLEKLMFDVLKMVERFSPAAEVAPEAFDAGDGASVAATGGAGPVAGVSAAAVTAVHTRVEALRLLDLVCAYYERAEPSSPLPLLIQRAKRLADMSFLEILKDLAPDGVSQAQNVTGRLPAD